MVRELMRKSSVKLHGAALEMANCESRSWEDCFGLVEERGQELWSASGQCNLVTVPCASRPFGKSTSSATQFIWGL
jgi:hypothetical protein